MEMILLFVIQEIYLMDVLGELQPALGIELGQNPCTAGVMLMELQYQSYAAHHGFRAGDIVLEIDGATIDTLNDMKDITSFRGTNKRHKFLIKRGEMVGEINV
eukprot:376479_1